MKPLEICTLLRQNIPLELKEEQLRGVSAEKWIGIVAYLAESMMIVDFWSRLNEQGLRSVVPEEAAELAAACSFLAKDRELSAFKELSEIDRALAESSLKALLLKGSALLCGGYFQNSGTRLFGDFDILIPPGELDSVVTCFESIGYQFSVNVPRPIEPWFEGGSSHHLPVLQKVGCQFHVELHTKPIRGTAFCSPSLDAKKMWENSSRSNSYESLYLPSPTDMLFHAFFHAQVVDHPHLKKTEVPRSYLDFEALTKDDKQIDEDKLHAYIVDTKCEGYFIAFSSRAYEVLELQPKLKICASFRRRRHWQQRLVQLGQQQSPWIKIPFLLKNIWSYIFQLFKNHSQRKQFSLLNPVVVSSTYVPLHKKILSRANWKSLFTRVYQVMVQ